MFNKGNLPTPSSENMGDLFIKNTFIIPPYQRPFAWGPGEINDLLNDIKRVARGREDLHFFGNIITLPTNNQNINAPLYLTDGQQRVTSSLVLIASIRDIAQQLSKQFITQEQTLKFHDQLHDITKDANTILFNNDQQHPIKSVTLQFRTTEMKNEQQRDYRKYFNNIITNKSQQTTKLYNPGNPSINNLNKAYQFLHNRLTSDLRHKDLSTKLKFLQELLNAFEARFYVIVMKAASSSGALIIYTTLNSRGKNLTIPQLIKGILAQVVGIHGRGVYKIMDQWDDMIDSFHHDDEKVINFINTYWSSRQQNISARELPRSIAQNIDTADKAIQMMNDLTRLAPIYRALSHPRRNQSLMQIPVVGKDVYILNQIGSHDFNALLLILLFKKISQTDLGKIAGQIMQIEMRNALTYGTYFDYDFLARKIKNQNWNVDQISHFLTDNMPDDYSVVKACMHFTSRLTKTGKRNSFIKYLLASYDAFKFHDFNDGKFIYQEIFADRNYGLILLDTSDRNIIRELGNFTIVEKSCLKAIPNRNINGVINLLNQSKLTGNHALAQKISICIQSGKPVSSLIQKRQQEIAYNYITIW